MERKITDSLSLDNENYLKGYEYETLMNALHVSVFKCLMNQEFTAIWCNDYFFESTGYSREEYISIFHYSVRDYFSCMAEEYNEIARNVMEAFQQGRTGFECLSRMPHKNGGFVWIKVVGTFTNEQRNGIPVLYVVYTDVSDVVEQQELRKRLEKQAEMLHIALDEAEQASRAKSDFLSCMSHDIRTPLNAIIGMTEIADSHLDNPQKVHDCHRKIALSSQHLLGLINDVLDMSKIESGKMTLNNNTVSLPKLLENVVAIIQPNIKAKEQNFSVRPHTALESIFSDPLRLHQIFLNILSNAVKFTPNGGSITFDIEEAGYQDEETILLRFIFSDTGIGMKPEFIAHIFDVFSREQDSRVDKTMGSGLGMAITKKIVDMMGGDIEIESCPNSGTTFRITLPFKLADVPYEDIKLSGYRVLFADDDDGICEYVDSVFHSLAIEGDCVTSGEDALVKVLQARDKKENYDAVILDWKMPALNGLQVAQKIRAEIGDSTPILIATAYDWEEIEEEAHLAGITGFLQKPLFHSTICNGLKKYILGSGSRQTKGEEKHFNFSGRKFLLAEDNELNREIAVELLSATGATVEWTSDGAQCLERFSSSPAGYYDLILMDVQMPVMDGYEATKAIRALAREDAKTVQIWAMTANAFVEDIEMAKAVGMNGHFAKPLNILSINREISRFLT